MLKVIVDDLYRNLMTKVLIANPLYRDLTRKVFAVNHLYRRFMRKVFVGAFVCGLMLSAWGGVRAEENSALAVQAGGGQAQPAAAPPTSAPATSTQAATTQPSTSGQAAAVPDEVIFREDEWVAYLNLPADQEAELKRALAVKHRHKSELADIPGVWLVWVDADKDQPPIIRLDVKEGTPVEIDRLAPL